MTQATLFRSRPKARRASRVGQEIVVDNFAGAGGASLGIEAALGRAIDIAINHDPDAIDTHLVNHPATRHLERVESIQPNVVAWNDDHSTTHADVLRVLREANV